MVNMQSYLFKLLTIAAVLSPVYSMPLEEAEGQVREVRPLFDRVSSLLGFLHQEILS